MAETHALVPGCMTKVLIHFVSKRGDNVANRLMRTAPRVDHSACDERSEQTFVCIIMCVCENDLLQVYTGLTVSISASEHHIRLQSICSGTVERDR